MATIHPLFEISPEILMEDKEMLFLGWYILLMYLGNRPGGFVYRKHKKIFIILCKTM